MPRKVVLARPILLQEQQFLDFSVLHQNHPEFYPFILESVAKTDAEGLGVYSMLLAHPHETVQLNPNDDAVKFVTQAQTALDAAKARTQLQIQWPLEFAFAKDQAKTSADQLPCHGGWFAYFSYDYAQVVEPVLELPASQFPLACLTRTPVAVVVDHCTNIAWILVEEDYANDALWIKLFADVEAALISDETPYQKADAIDIMAQQEEVADKYLNGVAAIKEYILSGDIFQVNISRLWQVALNNDQSYLDVYRALCRQNPAPFAAMCCLKDANGNPWQIISSSPERLAKFDGEWVDTRPIAGTRRRSDDAFADQALMQELIAHPKERAEHIMLIDLERNDLGRICQPGTVEVNELMVIESYQHVHHIVSNVRGKLREGFSPLDIVHALFPGGTITGCPKVRCMEIIAELEQMPREAYTGSLGYINLDGSMDLNILIRTMIAHRDSDSGHQLQFRAGAGIVADSDPAFELVETRHKARGLLRALGDQEA